jgi:hypothetical protein
MRQFVPKHLSLFLKIDLQENILALICHLVADESVFICGQGGGGKGDGAKHRNCRKKSVMVNDHYQLFMCIVVYVYN